MSGRRPRGQIIAIFAGAMLLFVLLAAAVIDLSWYWTNNLRMQRAADAAALAGVVFLPGREDLAIAAARAEAVKNGYTNGVGGYTITPVKDPSNSRRLKVNIRGPVGTYFARVIGISSWPASRDAKADFVLPVPMGSPENYYGVGFYEGRVPDTDLIAGNTDWNRPTQSVSGGLWSNPTMPSPTTTSTRPRTRTTRSSSGRTSTCRPTSRTTGRSSSTGSGSVSRTSA